MNDLLQRLRERVTYTKVMKHKYTAQVLQEALDTLLEYHKQEENKRFLERSEKIT